MQFVAGDRFELALFWPRSGDAEVELTVAVGQVDVEVESADLEGGLPRGSDGERDAVLRVQAAVRNAAQEELRGAGLSAAERLAAEGAQTTGRLPNHAAMRAKLVARVRKALGSKEQPIDVTKQNVGKVWSMQAPAVVQGRRIVLRAMLVAVTDCEVNVDAIRVG